jgi:hypothetical protein
VLDPHRSNIFGELRRNHFQEAFARESFGHRTSPFPRCRPSNGSRGGDAEGGEASEDGDPGPDLDGLSKSRAVGLASRPPGRNDEPRRAVGPSDDGECPGRRTAPARRVATKPCAPSGASAGRSGASGEGRAPCRFRGMPGRVGTPAGDGVAAGEPVVATGSSPPANAVAGAVGGHGGDLFALWDLRQQAGRHVRAALGPMALALAVARAAAGDRQAGLNGDVREGLLPPALIRGRRVPRPCPDRTRTSASCGVGAGPVRCATAGRAGSDMPPSCPSDLAM